MVFVAAAGNDACNTDIDRRTTLPASYNGVIGVLALDQTDNLAAFSNFGPFVDLVDLTTPGVNILSTIVGGVAFMSGTSMAAPHVSATAAAVLAIDPLFDRQLIGRLLALTSEDIGTLGTDDDFGAGVVRVDRAVEALADVYAEQSVPDCRNTMDRDYQTGWDGDWCGFLPWNKALTWCQAYLVVCHFFQ